MDYQNKLENEEPESPGDCEHSVHGGHEVGNPANPCRGLRFPVFIKHRGGLSTTRV